MPKSFQRQWLSLVVGAGCATSSAPPVEHAPAQEALRAPQVSFADDLAFLRQHSDLIVLSDQAQRARVIVAPQYQGRVMTSTATGDQGASFGFIHRQNIQSGERSEHINVFGGEDRFWLGPEAGQFGLFFAPGAPFDLAHWQTPEPIDWSPWYVSEQTGHSVSLFRPMQLTNFSGTSFTLKAERTIRVLERGAIAQAFGISIPDSASIVGYESANSITNKGDAPWRKDTGLLSVWTLGMFKPSPRTTVVLPFRPGPEAELGPIVNDAYFGKVPSNRLRVEDGVLFYRGDGQERGKIGIPGPRARPIVGAYDAQDQVLTLVQYNLDANATDYVNSLWIQQEKPYAGDVVNSYNDGPPEPGKTPLGPFFEIETSSKAAALVPGQALTHLQRTLHIVGPREVLDDIARRTLGVGLDRIENALPR
ncbi:MAG TPA: DUF6786 family protein [Polyangiales bacterium]|nr:DUF6786 family protein [Polyangiales bacterium]